MKPRCRGCEEEFGFACNLIEAYGWHLAMTEDRPVNIGTKEHICIMMVDEDGNVRVK